ncbi:hypothetical protein SAMN04489798_2171 [Pseudomonas arsenicoxydans]|uniref:Uncharacterized protein n=1 Tax=Pseudomonas arsenicoxydans TaxID=702115 RepID=A0A1H0H814_9PSED|nr:hypothetical protein SAMN04489798_2171 [Pseudomonas arsenicoxydans]
MTVRRLRWVDRRVETGDPTHGRPSTLAEMGQDDLRKPWPLHYSPNLLKASFLARKRVHFFVLRLSARALRRMTNLC